MWSDHKLWKGVENIEIYDESGEPTKAPSKKKGVDEFKRKPYALFDEMDNLFDDYRRAFDEMFWPVGSAGPRIRSGKMLRAMPEEEGED